MTERINRHVGVLGLSCPLPLIHLARAVKEMGTGEIVEIIGNDPIFETSILDFCRSNGHAVLDVTRRDDNASCLIIRIGG